MRQNIQKNGLLNLQWKREGGVRKIEVYITTGHSSSSTKNLKNFT